jgi:hypothetical protein
MASFACSFSRIEALGAPVGSVLVGSKLLLPRDHSAIVLRVTALKPLPPVKSPGDSADGYAQDRPEEDLRSNAILLALVEISHFRD